MPYHDLGSIAVQRFATLDDIDASSPTIEEREEYERPVEIGMVMYAGVDYGAILEQAQEEADVVIWDGGNNDFSFYRPDLSIVVVDPLRAGHAARYHPGEATLRMADVVIVNKVDAATRTRSTTSLRMSPRWRRPPPSSASASPVLLEPGPSLNGERVLVIEDGPTITHGGMPFGAGTVAARQANAIPVDPRPYAVGSIAETLAQFPHTDKVVPAMGYSDAQLRDLRATIDSIDCDAVIAGTPVDLRRLIDSRHPIREVTYALEELGEPRLADVLAPIVAQARQKPTIAP